MQPFKEYLKEHLEQLRKSYVNATPEQRYRVALDRLRYPNCGPNVLIHAISTVEGLARALALDLAQKNGENVEEAYEKLRYPNAKKLIEEHILPNLKETAETFVDKEIWKNFCLAIEYRNLLVHECAFLRKGISNKLIKSACIVLQKLCEIAGLPEKIKCSENGIQVIDKKRSQRSTKDL